MEHALENYIQELESDIASWVYSDGEGASFEDKFTEYCMEVFESIGKVEGARVLSYIHPNDRGGIDWKLNGYGLRDKDENGDFGTLDLFITYYRNNNYNYTIKKDEYDKTLNQIKKFINEALKRHINIDSSYQELNGLVKIIGSQGDKFDRINIHFLINGFSNYDKDKIEIRDITIFIDTWDIDRLFKIYTSNSNHEPIEIDFENFTEEGKGLQCLQVPNIDELYECYLAIVPGEILAKLYKEYSSELLESNVRAFLGQTGKFNKGIRDTIKNNPQMFLPYNNGITATAESVETKIVDNQRVITKLYDFQIVNGGQTTASLYHTQKKHKADLSKIFVQMKLTVIKDKEQKNIEVPNISRFANSQNKVSELDLSSNNPYFVQIENLSRRKYVQNSEHKNQPILWFFERANGQYRETLNKQTPALQKKFKEQNPSHLKFVKSDIAKYINIWELEPHIVSQGSQKNFIHYTKKINDLVSKNKLPSDNFYRKLIANAILFKTTDRLFGRKGVDAIGETNLKSFTVAYTLSYFHFQTDNRLDLWTIYENQRIDDALQEKIKEVLIFVYTHLVANGGSMISEYAKKSTTWETLKKEQYSEKLIDTLASFLIPLQEKEQRENEKEIDTGKTSDRISLIDEIYKRGFKFWDGFKIYLTKNELKGFDFVKIQELHKCLKDKKDFKNQDITFGKKVIDYISINIDLEDYIINLSNVEEEEEKIPIQFIYDKLLHIENREWNRIIDIASQTKIFDNLELSNVKSIRNTLNKKDNVREQSLIKAYNSIKKLNRFGVIID